MAVNLALGGENKEGVESFSGEEDTVQHTKLQVTLSCEINNMELIAAQGKVSGKGVSTRG